MQASSDHDDYVGLDFAAKLSEDLEVQLRVNEEMDLQNGVAEGGELSEKEEEEEFSFFCGGGDTSPIAAEDAFVNGQIKPIFPLFNRDLLEGLPERPLVKKLFVEMDDDDEDGDGEDVGVGRGTMLMAASASSDGEISGPYCEWSKDTPLPESTSAPEPSPEGCKKSNSTGFSKLWRFRDLLHRSNSDGRDAYVFLNNQPTTSSAGKKEEKKASREGEVKVKVHEQKGKVKKGGKSKKTLSPHEIYMRSKAKDDDRRRSYLPYRPEVFGFFTNVNGGMSRNVHPF